MNIQETKLFIQEVLTTVIEDISTGNETYDKYFSKDYIQHVNSETLNYEQFKKHMKILKNTMECLKVEFHHILVEDQHVITVHQVNGVKKDKNKIKVKVMAMFKIVNNKIVLCKELTYLLEGERSDQDLGSRH